MKDLQTHIIEKTFKLRLENEALLLSQSLPRAEFSVFESRPSENVRGGIVLVQEIFGVNSHIREVARKFAKAGYVVWAPAYFDHIEPGVELNYGEESFPIGRSFVSRLGWEAPLDDTLIATRALKKSLPEGKNKVAVIGYCWGGSLAWLAACRLADETDACVSYYGRQTLDFKAEEPRVPLIMHFGRHDKAIPVDQVEDLSRLHPTLPVYIYEAGHGFNCDMRADYDAQASQLAEERTLKFLAENLT